MTYPPRPYRSPRVQRQIDKETSPEFTAERVKEVLDYDPETGIFIRKVSRFNPQKVGKPAGCKNPRGYVFIYVGGESFAASRLAYLIMTGKWPQGHMDHVNRNPSDNRWSNLREATVYQNMANRKTKKQKYPRGVCQTPQTKTFHARISVRGTARYFMGFATPEEAHAEYLRQFAIIHGMEFYPKNTEEPE